jgi:hypothetical protein
VVHQKHQRRVQQRHQVGRRAPAAQPAPESARDRGPRGGRAGHGQAVDERADQPASGDAHRVGAGVVAERIGGRDGRHRDPQPVQGERVGGERPLHRAPGRQCRRVRRPAVVGRGDAARPQPAGSGLEALAGRDVEGAPTPEVDRVLADGRENRLRPSGPRWRRRSPRLT